MPQAQSDPIARYDCSLTGDLHGMVFQTLDPPSSIRSDSAAADDDDYETNSSIGTPIFTHRFYMRTRPQDVI